MSTEVRDPQPYEAPAIEQRDAIDTALIGTGSAVACAAFTHQ